MKHTTLTIILLLCVMTDVFTQNIVSVNTTEKGERKKVGIVLSGGGAKGFTHIGVLKVLEEIEYFKVK